jgi:hypothetical protein
MLRALLAVSLAAVLVGCDDEDPATSEHCVMVRMRYIEGKFWRDRLVGLGSQPAVVADADAGLARLQSENWQCFRPGRTIRHGASPLSI